MSSNTLRRDTVLNLFGFIIPAAAAIPALAILARYLAPSEFGLFILLTSLGSFASVFDFGIGRFITIKLALSKNKEQDEIDQLIANALFSAVLISVLLSILVFFFFDEISLLFLGKNYSNEKMKILIIITLITIELSAFIQITQSVLDGKFNFFESNKIKLLGGILQSWLPVVFIIISTELLYGMLAVLVSRVLTLVIGLNSLRLKIAFFKKIKLESIKNIYCGAFPLAISGLSSLMMTNIDRVIVSSSVGGNIGSIYTTASDFLNRNAVIPGAFLRALLPRLAVNNISNQSADRKVFFRFLIFTTIISLIILLFSKQLLSVMFGHFFSEYYKVLQIMTGGFFFNIIGGYYITLINSRGRNYICALLHTAELPAFFLVLLYLSMHHGVEGAAIAYSLRCILDCLVLGIINKHQQRYSQ